MSAWIAHQHKPVRPPDEKQIAVLPVRQRGKRAHRRAFGKHPERRLGIGVDQIDTLTAADRQDEPIIDVEEDHVVDLPPQTRCTVGSLRWLTVHIHSRMHRQLRYSSAKQ